MRIVAIGGGDAGTSAALRALDVAPSADVTLITVDPAANFSGSGIPFHLSGEVPEADVLAHRSTASLEAAGVRLMLETTARGVDPAARQVAVTDTNGRESTVAYDQLILALGAAPVVPDVEGLRGPEGVKPADGVHVLRSMSDAAAVTRTLLKLEPETVAVVGAGFVGMEMAEALALRGLSVTLFEKGAEVLPDVDAEIGALARAQLETRGVEVMVGAPVRAVCATGKEHARLVVDADRGPRTVSRRVDMVLFATGVRPRSRLAASMGVELGRSGAIVVDRAMRTNLPDVLAAGDCAMTLHRLLGPVYQPAGTTSHKQGVVAGENAAGGTRRFAGSLGTKVLKVFDHAVAWTGVSDADATAGGFQPLTVGYETLDRAGYYPGSRPVVIRMTGDTRTRRLIGVQVFGHTRSEISSRIAVASAAMFNNLTIDQIGDLDLPYAPPFGQVWDPLAQAAQEWITRLG